MDQNADTNLDQDLANSRLAKYENPQLQKEVKVWITDILGNEINLNYFNSSDLMDSLKDGVILCQLINKIFGNETVKYKDSKIAFMQMENIEKFLRFCQIKGIQHDELFQTVDLFEKKDPYQVIMGLQSFSRMVYKETNGKFPFIGPSIAKKNIRPPKPPKPEHLLSKNGGVPWSSIEYGYMNGSNQQTESVVFGGRRDIVHK
ncbi:hypothetical protein CANINC_000510 [Pichia inconspicua]|uniref:Calponin-homology (CH) domain-containing protein n=1 Tax=Pichia inconspicua TaxID=52247 RepID=A0A4T0X606_9ASCO|nr:hypothetical protein CANINC_000510 [[Candida] inconspicua]